MSLLQNALNWWRGIEDDSRVVDARTGTTPDQGDEEFDQFLLAQFKLAEEQVASPSPLVAQETPVSEASFAPKSLDTQTSSDVDSDSQPDSPSLPDTLPLLVEIEFVENEETKREFLEFPSFDALAEAVIGWKRSETIQAIHETKKLEGSEWRPSLSLALDECARRDEAKRQRKEEELNALKSQEAALESQRVSIEKALSQVRRQLTGKQVSKGKWQKRGGAKHPPLVLAEGLGEEERDE